MKFSNWCTVRFSGLGQSWTVSSLGHDATQIVSTHPTTGYHRKQKSSVIKLQNLSNTDRLHTDKFTLKHLDTANIYCETAENKLGLHKLQSTTKFARNEIASKMQQCIKIYYSMFI